MREAISNERSKPKLAFIVVINIKSHDQFQTANIKFQQSRSTLRNAIYINSHDQMPTASMQVPENNVNIDSLPILEQSGANFGNLSVAKEVGPRRKKGRKKFRFQISSATRN
jgi:hypothetical protein